MKSCVSYLSSPRADRRGRWNDRRGLHCWSKYGRRHPLPLVLLIVSTVVIGPACQGQEEEAPTVPSNSELTIAELSQQWIAQLDGDRFETRHRAQSQLEQAGQPALEAVAAIAQTGSLESSTRAINILLKWSEAPQQELRLAALEKLANLPNRPRESAMATRLLANVREQTAVAEISKLGGQVTPLNGYSNLRVRIGAQWKGGDEGLKHLAHVRRAAIISLHVAPITDAGLEHLAGLKQVQKIEIYSTNISDAATEKLKQQLPAAFIETRDGAMLGILGNIADVGKQSVGIDNVVKGSAAHKAGILPGDRVAEINGEKVTDFTDLTTRIKKFAPGTTVKLTILRKDKAQEVDVTFDPWGATDNTKLVVERATFRTPQVVPPVLPGQRR